MNKPKLKKILQAMNGERIDFSEFDSAVSTLRKSLEEKVAIPTLDKVNNEIEKFRNKLDITPLLTALEEVKTNVNTRINALSAELEDRLSKQKQDAEFALDETLSSEISNLKVQIASLDTVGKGELTNVVAQVTKLYNQTQKTIAEIKVPPDRIKEITGLQEEVSKNRTEMISRINERGVGNMNRQILVGGNTSTLGKYTDINLKAGSNVTITYTNNETTKRTDITFSSSGGGGSVGGTVRSINNVNTSQAMGDTAGTDYVYIASAGIKLDLPAATGNTNLYTVKNVSNSSVLVAGTIDGDIAGVIMPIKYTSVDIISNDTDWNIT